MRSGRIINVTPCIDSALAVFALAHLETIARADDGERGGAAATAPTTGDPEHNLHNLEQVDNATEHARAEGHTDGERQHTDEWVENRRGRLQNRSH